MKDIQANSFEKVVLEDEEKDRLVRFFNVLIEMDLEQKRNNERNEDNINVLLDPTSNTPLAS